MWKEKGMSDDLSTAPSAGLITRALSIIEEISACEQDEFCRYGDADFARRRAREMQEAICRIFRIAHAGQSPLCNRRHPDWLKEIEEWPTHER